MASSGTPFSSKYSSACSAFSRELNTPTAVSKRNSLWHANFAERRRSGRMQAQANKIVHPLAFLWRLAEKPQSTSWPDRERRAQRIVFVFLLKRPHPACSFSREIDNKQYSSRVARPTKDSS